jgi:tetratricopeptide (TPR) repeat protein
METPEGMKIVTPGSNANPNTPTRFEEDVANSNIVFTTEETTANTVSLPLGFNGRSASELGGLLIAARNYAQAGRTLLAEETYTQSLEGFQHVLGQLHATTVKAAFELATFYFQQNRKADADQILEQLTTTHIRLLGFEDRRTKQHILHIGELLNSLRREEDALAFLSHAHELAQKSDNGASSKNSGKAKGKAKARQEPVQSGKNILLATTIDIRNDPNLSNINHGLDSARLHVAANEPAVVALLKAIESQCLHEPAKFGIQGIHARAELLRYYLKEGVHFANKDFFLGARDSLRTYWTAMQYEATSCKIQEAVEAALELTAAVLRGHFDTFAKEMFGLVETDIVKMLGDQDERTIWMWISIGIVYQTHRTWDVAQRWFERAWAAADALWGSADGITRSLSAALFGNKHFSYLNNEGRPFKTIFGVCGFTIRPTRLHLE